MSETEAGAADGRMGEGRESENQQNAQRAIERHLKLLSEAKLKYPTPSVKRLRELGCEEKRITEALNTGREKVNRDFDAWTKEIIGD